jgi:hypothetical protein
MIDLLCGRLPIKELLIVHAIALVHHSQYLQRSARKSANHNQIHCPTGSGEIREDSHPETHQEDLPRHLQDAFIQTTVLYHAG